MADVFSYKLVAENKLLSFDFAEVLTTGETISTASCTVIVIDGTDAGSASLLSGSPTISGSKTYQRVQGGVSEVTYRLIMTITTSLGNTLVSLGDLPVYSPAAIQ